MSESNNKRIAKNTLLLYIRMFLLLLVSLYTSRVILNALGAVDYGIYNVVGGVITALSFFTTSMAGATQRFISYAIGLGNKDALKEIFSGCLKLHLIVAVCFIFLAETLGLWFVNNVLVIPVGQIYAANWVYQFSIVSFVVTVISVPYNATIIAHERMSAFAYISILEAAMKLLISYFVAYTIFNKLIVYGLLLALVSVLLQFVYSGYCRKHFQEARFSIRCKNSVVKKIGKYIGWSLYANLSGVAYGQGLNMLLNVFFGPAVNAARALAYQIQGAVQRFTTSFQMAVNPQIIKLYAQENFDEMYKLINRSSKFSFYLMLVITLPLFTYADKVLEIWLKNVPDYSVAFCRLILIVSLIDTVSNPLTTATQATGKLKLNALLGGTNLLIIIPISYVFLKMGYPPQSIFYVNIVFAVNGLLIRLYINNRLISFPVREFIFNVFLKCWTIALLAFIVPIALRWLVGYDILSMVCISLLSIFISFILIYFYGLEKNERSFICDRIRVIIAKITKNV